MPWIKSSAHSELAKHLSTLRLGWDVAFMRATYKMCEAKGLDFGLVYTEFTRAYNTAYHGQAKERPVLTPDRGRSASHCVFPNAEKLAAQTDSRSSQKRSRAVPS